VTVENAVVGHAIGCGQHRNDPADPGGVRAERYHLVDREQETRGQRVTACLVGPAWRSLHSRKSVRGHTVAYPG
jgi:hypothetical protein